MRKLSLGTAHSVACLLEFVLDQIYRIAHVEIFLKQEQGYMCRRHGVWTHSCGRVSVCMCVAAWR